jgi:hypothetical protein
MKALPKYFVLLNILALLSGAAFGESAAQLLSEAQTAYLRGDFETAKRNFELVNKLDPRNQTAIGYLRMLKARETKTGGGAKQEKELQALIVPQVQFHEATLGSALDYLKQQVTKLSDGKTSVNFVVQLPDEKVKSTTVTLNLTKIPFTEVLRYVGEIANVTFTYEPYAIAVRPKAPTPPVAANAPGAGQ